MIWQDKWLGIIGFTFAFSMIPSILSDSKPALWSSGMTAIGLTAMAVIMLTLKLKMTALSTALTATAWWVLVAQGVF